MEQDEIYQVWTDLTNHYSKAADGNIAEELAPMAMGGALVDDFPIQALRERDMSDTLVRGMYDLWVPIHMRGEIATTVPEQSDRRQLEHEIRSRMHSWRHAADTFENRGNLMNSDIMNKLANRQALLHHFSVTADQAPLLAAAFLK